MWFVNVMPYMPLQASFVLPPVAEDLLKLPAPNVVDASKEVWNAYMYIQGLVLYRKDHHNMIYYYS